MIYFDDTKQAYGFEIENYICKIEDDLWSDYAHTDKWDIINGEFVDISETEEYKKKKEKEEQERVAHLTMTALDFINALKQTGLTALQIKEYLDANIELDQQLKYCQNVYCGVVLQLCPLDIGDTGITLTKEDVVKAFKVKNGRG